MIKTAVVRQSVVCQSSQCVSVLSPCDVRCRAQERSRLHHALIGKDTRARPNCRGVNMIFYPNERIAIFIDGANVHATVKAMGISVDYKRLLEFFRSQARLVRATYYTAVFENQEIISIRPLLDWLDYNGYRIVTKPIKEYADDEGRRKLKGNIDVELAVDTLELATHLDHVVLFSGDGNFRALVQALQQMGLRVSVVSTLTTQSAMVAEELRRQADQFIDLAEIERYIDRDPDTRPPRAARHRSALPSSDDASES